MTFSVQRLFLTVPWVGLQCVIVVFPGHTHLHSELPLKVGYWAIMFAEVIFKQIIRFSFKGLMKDSCNSCCNFTMN